jgi:hypothetical protein
MPHGDEVDIRLELALLVVEIGITIKAAITVNTPIIFRSVIGLLSPCPTTSQYKSI